MTEALIEARQLADALLSPLMLMGLRISPTAWLFARLERQTEILRAEITAQGARTDQAIKELVQALDRTTTPVEQTSV